MPLRDHFRPPIDDKFSWDMLHAMMPGVISARLNDVLPEPYFAGPGVHLGSVFEVDIATFREPYEVDHSIDPGEGGTALAVAPPRTTVSFEPKLPQQDVYEVRIYDGRRKRSLVAAIEIVSPSNKHSEEHRAAFRAKVTQLVKNNICVSIVDVVSTEDQNLCREVFDYIDGPDDVIGTECMYAATLRSIYRADKRSLDAWYYPLAIGQPMPVLPIWLSPKHSVNLDLEVAYEECCRSLKIK